MPKFIYHDTQWTSNNNDSNTFFTGITGDVMTSTIQESNQFFLWTHDDKELMKLTSGANLTVQNGIITSIMSMSNISTDILPLIPNIQAIGEQSKPFKELHVSGDIFASNALAPFVRKEGRVLAGTGLQGGGCLSNDITLSLATFGTSGAYGGSNNIPVITADTYGRISSIALSPVSGSLVNIRMFTSSSNYTPSSNTKQVVFHIIGGGGGGGACCANDYSAGGGGGAGGYCIAYVKNLSSGPYAYTIGTGGTAGSNNSLENGNGCAGGCTRITINGTTYMAHGGLGGVYAETSGAFAEGEGGLAENGFMQTPGENGFCGIASSTMIISGRGGSTIYGRGGASVYFTSPGNAGQGYGGGGSGGGNFNSEEGQIGGVGAPGIIVAFEYS